jgi:thiamine pyrophosphate-dependent acetolactate synthase large subunit-like protein
MAMEIPIMKVSDAKYNTCDISGNYSDMAKAFGGYSERITHPDEIVPALKRGIAATERGEAVLLEFITCKETDMSLFYSSYGGKSR